MFLENAMEGLPLYTYADIKVNVLFERENKSMICEVQFLLDFMIHAKKLGHSIYEIQRTKEFKNNVFKLITLYKSRRIESHGIAERRQSFGQIFRK